MKPSNQLARGAGVAFIVMCVLAYAAWMLQAELNTLRAFEVPSEVVETTRDGAAMFHLQRDPTNWRSEAEMAALPDDIFWMKIAVMSMGMAALIVPFWVMGKMGRRKQ